MRLTGLASKVAVSLLCACALVADALAAGAPAGTLPGAASARWRTLIERHAQQQNAGSVLRTVVEFDTDEAGPPACQQGLRIADTARVRWLGLLTVPLQCDQPAWRWSVSVRVRGMGQVVQANRSLPSGWLLAPDDVRLVETDLASEPPGVATEVGQVLGRETLRPLRDNTSLPLNALRLPAVIKAGDRVTVRVLGRSFQISAEGVAQQAGAVGDTIRVKLPDGKQVSAAVVQAGHVDVKL